VQILDNAPEAIRNTPALVACRIEARLARGGTVDEIRAALTEMAGVVEKLPADAHEDRARIHSSLGAAYLRIGDRSDAEGQWLKAADLQPKDTQIRLMLFDLASQSGDVAKMNEIRGWFVKEYPEETAQNKYLEAAALLVKVNEAQRAKPAGEQLGLDESQKRDIRNARSLLVDVQSERPR